MNKAKLCFFLFTLPIIFLFVPLAQGEGLGFGEVCNHTIEFHCDPLKYLQCGILTNLCECMKTHDTWYDPVFKMCRLLVGEDCARTVFDQPCVANSYCPEAPNPTCTCDVGFDENVNRQCFLAYRSQCASYDIDPGNADRCDPAGFLKCAREGSEYLCKCRDFDDAEFYPTTKTCHLLANTSCSPLDGAMPCIDNANCNIFDRTCHCDEEFLNTPERRCHLSHGATCDPWVDTCNIPGHVACHKDLEKCLCTPYEESMYYPGELGCRLLEGAGCAVIERSQRCINDATCIPSEGAEPYRCRCSGNFSPNKNRECYLTHGDPCDLSQDYCDPAGFLGCSSNNNLCGCGNPDSFYDPSAKECRYALGAKCKPGLVEQPCGNNAVCDLTLEICRCETLHEDARDGNCLRSHSMPCSIVDLCNGRNQLNCYYGRCECNPGFMPSAFGSSPYEITCLPGYQQRCPYDEELQLDCAPEPNLSCINGTCTCTAPGHHIPEEQRCAVLVGNDCIPSSNNMTNVCVTNAFCGNNGLLPGKCVCEFGYEETIYGFCVSGGMRSNNGKLFVVIAAMISLKI